MKLETSNYLNAIVIATLALLGAVRLGAQVSARELPSIAASTPVAATAMLPIRDVAARAAVVYDLRDERVLFEKNASAPLPLASLTKLLTAAVALQRAPLDAPIRISRSALAAAGDSGFREGEVLPLGDILRALLVASSNDAAAALNEELGGHEFLDAMREYARVAALPTVTVRNASGLDVDATTPGASASALDVARLLDKLYEEAGGVFAITRQEQVASGGELLHNTNNRVGTLPNIALSKTGFTDLAGGNLAVIMEIAPLHPVAIVILGSTEEARFDEVNRLAEAVVDLFGETPYTP